VLVRHLVVSLSLAAAGVAAPVAASYAAGPSDLYVTTGGDDARSCTQAHPCATVQRAVHQSAASGTTIHVGAGTFPGQVVLGGKNLRIVGNSTDGTVLTPDADSIDDVVEISAGTVRLSRLTVSGGFVTDVLLYQTGVLKAHDIVLEDSSGCGLAALAGTADLTDSVVRGSGTLDCNSDAGNPLHAGVAIGSATVTLTRTHVLDPAPHTSGVMMRGGSLTTDQSFFGDSDPDTNQARAIEVVQGVAKIRRSVVHGFDTGVDVVQGTAKVSDSTFEGNLVGVYDEDQGSATVVRSTFQNGVGSVRGKVALAGSLLGIAPTGIANCDGTITDLGYNLSTDHSCAFKPGTGSQGDVADLNLDTQLADRGGPLGLPTVAIFDPSSAMDTIPAGATYGGSGTPLCAGTDLRGVPRPSGGACDAGSMEMAETVTKLHAPEQAAPHDDLEVTAELSSRNVDLGLDLPNGTVTFRANGTVVCADVFVDRSEATCFIPDLEAGSLRITAAFTPMDGNTVHPSRSGPKTVLVGTTPVLKGPGTVRARIGRSVDVSWSASGEPAPRVRKAAGRLPAGLRYSSSRGKATITGTPEAGTAGTYRLRVRATNLVGQDIRRVTLVVARR
jgi:hypothetical protein